MELKYPKVELDTWVLNERKKVILNGSPVYIGPFELQIPFKLFLGSEKDIEDAKYLYNIFKENLDKTLLQDFNRKLKVEELFTKYVE